MSFNLTPIATALALLVSHSAHADGGLVGSNGASYGANISLIGDVQSGPVGVSGNSNANGGHALGIEEQTIIVGDENWVQTVITGDAGDPGESVSQSGPGAGGHGGASVIGGISIGGAAGAGSTSSANGGNGGNVTDNQVTLTKVDIDGSGAAGGAGGTSSYGGGGGAAGHGGGSVFGGISTGGAAGRDFSSVGSTAILHFALASGGNGGNVTDNQVTLMDVDLDGSGAAGGAGGGASFYGGGGGAAGHGGGSVFGGISTGGVAGVPSSQSNSSSGTGGNGGDVSSNTIKISNSTLAGAAGGAGGSVTSSYNAYPSRGGGGGAAGHGGGSVFGGISTGGAGGSSSSSSSHNLANGGNGGNVSSNAIEITNSTLAGAAGGAGGSVTSSLSPSASGGGGAGGHGGGSVFGGISTGGAAGFSYISNYQYDPSYSPSPSSSYSASASGGNGGNVTDNQITLADVHLDGSSAAGGAGGSSTSSLSASASASGGGAGGHGGGAVFGGISQGGAGGHILYGTDLLLVSTSVNGGAGGNVLSNKITISGVSTIFGDIYGGISQGGDRGKSEEFLETVQYGQYGQGGLVQDNIITLIGTGLTIKGSIYGGLSINGDQSINPDADYTSYYKGNTLNLKAYRGSVKGIHNIEIYNWDLPDDVVHNDTIITITGDDPVNLDNTKHTVFIDSQGNKLMKGDKVTLIDKAVGTPRYINNEVGAITPIDAQVGYLLLQNSLLQMIDGGAVLTMQDDAIINPRAKAFLEKRAAAMGLNTQGSDMMADYSMDQGACKNNLFVVTDGGSSSYKIRSQIDLRDFKMALGGAHCFELPSQSQVMVGGFGEYGRGNFDSYSRFKNEPEVHGWGKVHYQGVGALFHMNVAGTSKSQASKPLLQGKDGLYLNAVLRVGKSKSDFVTDDLTDAQGTPGRYDSTATYYSAMAGMGYAINFNDQHALDVYGRYNWSRIGTDSVLIGNDRLDFDSTKSSSLRVGARYRFAVSQQAVPYVGLAYEREIGANATGSTVYRGKTYEVDPVNIKGNTGIAELGMTITPVANKDALTLNLGVKGYFGLRKGASASVNLRYVF